MTLQAHDINRYEVAPDWQHRYLTQSSPEAGSVHDFLAQRQELALASLRVPVRQASSRIGLAEDRLAHLASLYERERTRLINVQPWMQREEVRDLEQRCDELARQMHEERRELWRDLRPLLVESKDAAVDSMRQAFLNELMDLGKDGGDRW